jgi:hypothetical protein
MSREKYKFAKTLFSVLYTTAGLQYYLPTTKKRIIPSKKLRKTGFAQALNRRNKVSQAALEIPLLAVSIEAI